MRLTLILLFTLLTATNSFAQIESIAEKKVNFSISGLLIDSETNNPILYATFYNITSERGTLSNYNGKFQFDGLRLNDTIVISYVGYYSKQIIIDKSHLNETITLSPKTETLSQFTLFDNDDLLYQLMVKCKETQTEDLETAKTYYVLKSNVNGKQVELVESYFNGKFRGYDIDELKLKNGRIALAEFDDRYYISTESSKAIYLHKLFQESNLFPTSPLELELNELKKRYKLKLVSTHLNDLDHKVYVIDFDPLTFNHTSFNGRIWIDSNINVISKIDLEIENTFRHPFEPFGDINKIINVDLKLSKTFELRKGKPQFVSTNFDYKIHYKSNNSIDITSQTNAVIYAYNFDSEFILPEFKFTKTDFKDYNQISASPYNVAFWDNMNEFKMGSISDEQNHFISLNSVDSNRSLFVDNTLFKKGIFRPPYLTWKKQRVALHTNPNLGRIPNNGNYQIKTQIYMDVNMVNDTLNFVTQTVFDPFMSFFYFPKTNQTKAFINMYFDLTEINRRKLETALKEAKTIAEAQYIYKVKNKEFEAEYAQFLKDTQIGEKRIGMLNWNDYIISELNIDNISIFNPFQEPNTIYMFNTNRRNNNEDVFFDPNNPPEPNLQGIK